VASVEQAGVEGECRVSSAPMPRTYMGNRAIASSGTELMRSCLVAFVNISEGVLLSLSTAAVHCIVRDLYFNCRHTCTSAVSILVLQLSACTSVVDMAVLQLSALLCMPTHMCYQTLPPTPHSHSQKQPRHQPEAFNHPPIFGNLNIFTGVSIGCNGLPKIRLRPHPLPRHHRYLHGRNHHLPHTQSTPSLREQLTSFSS